MMQQQQQPRREGGDRAAAQELGDSKVRDLISLLGKRRLVEVPYTASLSHTMNTLVANRVVAVPVAAPPGQWIGAGGSMIMEADKQTGVVRKHYIGMVTMLDILAHIAGSGTGDGIESNDLDRKMAVPVSSIIGHCLEGLSLWTLNPNTSLVDCMEVLTKGIHRALVPEESQNQKVEVLGVELVESASSYQMLTQMDLLRFLKANSSALHHITSRSITELGALNQTVYAITNRTKVVQAIHCMRAALLIAVPIVQASKAIEEDHTKLVNGKGRKLIGTFSATDLRGCHLATLETWLPQSALEFTEKVSTLQAGPQARELVSCHGDESLGEVINKALSKHVHRIWVVNQQGFLQGLVSLSDIIKALKAALLPNSQP